jgi:N-acetyl-anhydromuramyl-L-alanine amidase AmpD
MSDATRRFLASPGGTSAHYVVGVDGAIAQFVQETDTAFHAGLVINPAAQVVIGRPRVNPNFYSIGIEHEGGAPWSQPQIAASAQLIADIASRWSIPLDEHHVVPHSALRASAECPGKGCDIAVLLGLARGLRRGAAVPSHAVLHIILRANVRSRPSISAPVTRILQPGSTFTAAAFTRGDLVSGNDNWYVDESGSYLWAGVTDRPQPAEAADSDDESAPSTDPMEKPELPSPAPAAAPSDSFPVDRSLALPPKDYYAAVTKKDLIVLHFTAGRTAASAIQTWRGDPQHVATAYAVDNDGTIFEAFDPSFWAYHLGIKGVSLHDKRSIGIEIANVGPLRRTAAGDALNWWPSKFGQRYCGIEESGRYVKSEYRGEKYFASFAQPQMEAVGKLVRHLAERFSIPAVVAGSSRRSEFDPAFFSGFQGIATHSNFRLDKWDIGPAYDWETLGL